MNFISSSNKPFFFFILLYQSFVHPSMIHWIRPILPFDSNCYLLTGDSNILIDTGTGLAGDRLVEQVRSILGPDRTLDKVLLTHCHFDHIGGGPALISAFGCEVLAGSVDAASVRASDVRYTLSDHFEIDVPAYPVTDLGCGDIIDIGAHRLRVIDTPGHTPGGVCYYDEISSSLFSGDTVFTNGVGRTDFNGGSTSSLINSIK